MVSSAAKAKSGFSFAHRFGAAQQFCYTFAAKSVGIWFFGKEHVANS